MSRTEESDNRYRTKFWLTLAMIFLIPAFLINHVFSRFIEEFELQINNEQANTARLIMAGLQAEMSEQHVVQQAIEKFTKQHLNKFGNTLSPEAVKNAETQFKRTFTGPKSLVWFDGDFKIVTPQGSGEIDQRRAWQAFARAVFNKQSVSMMEKRIADGFVKSNISDFLNSDFFSSQPGNCTKIVFKGTQHYIAFVRIRASAEKAVDEGYLIILLSSENARKYWLEQRAIKLSIKSGNLAGGFFISNNEFIEGSSISENQLHGFYEKYRRGESYLISEDTLYYCETCYNNPDLFLAAGINFSSNYMTFIRLVRLLLSSLWLPGLACFFPLVLKKPTGIATLSLKARFNGTAIALTTIPLLITVLFGLIHTASLRIEEQRNAILNQGKLLDSIEEQVAASTAACELFLRTDLPKMFSTSPIDKNTADEIYSEVEKFGCELVTLVSTEADTFLSTRLPVETIKSRICYQLSFISTRLENDGFNMDLIEKKYPPPTRGFNVDILQNDGPNLKQEFHDRILRIEMGHNLFSSFSTYIRNEKGDIIACLLLGIDYRQMRQNFLNSAIEAARSEKLRAFAYAKNSKGAVNLPASEKLRNILMLSGLTGDSFEFMHEWNRKKYLVTSRPLKDIDNAAMIIREISQAGITANAEQTIMLLLIILASLGVASTIINYFDLYFLKPLLMLSKEASEVESGNYDIPEEPMPENELGILFTNFSSLIKGLKEKAEMKNFLQHDLVQNVENQLETNGKKTFTTILFAGLRDFSGIEAELQPEEAMDTMNCFLSACENAVRLNHGEIDKFMGETAMAIFSEKADLELAQTRAINAAIKIIEDTAANEKTRKFVAGAGIASGNVIAGSIGSRKKRLDFTYIGDTVNLAARLEKLAGTADFGKILIKDNHQQNCFDNFVISKRCEIKVKGKDQSVQILAVEGRKSA